MLTETKTLRDGDRPRKTNGHPSGKKNVRGVGNLYGVSSGVFRPHYWVGSKLIRQTVKKTTVGVNVSRVGISKNTPIH